MHLYIVSSPTRTDRGCFARTTKLVSDTIYQQVANLLIPLSQILPSRPAKTDYLLWRLPVRSESCHPTSAPVLPFQAETRFMEFKKGKTTYL
jgi:hypothetical protein